MHYFIYFFKIEKKITKINLDTSIKFRPYVYSIYFSLTFFLKGKYVKKFQYIFMHTLFR